MSASPDSHMNDLPGTIWDASSINQFAWCNFKLGTMSHKVMTPKCKLLKVTQRHKWKMFFLKQCTSFQFSFNV